jgi:aspartyl protease family protein
MRFRSRTRKTASGRAQTGLVGDPRLLAAGRFSIPRDAHGHFHTEGRIDGQRIDFMIDTGASVIALNEKSAARFGLCPAVAETTRA